MVNKDDGVDGGSNSGQDDKNGPTDKPATPIFNDIFPDSPPPSHPPNSLNDPPTLDDIFNGLEESTKGSQKKGIGKDTPPDGSSEEPLKSISGNSPWLPRPKKKNSLWKWGVVGGATALLALTIGLSKEYLPELFNKFSASYQTRSVEQVVREPSPSQKMVEPQVQSPSLKPVPAVDKIVGLTKSTPSIVNKPRSKKTLENRLSKNPRLARLLRFEKGLNEEFTKPESRYSSLDSPAYYNIVVGLAEDRTRENELQYTITKATDTIGESYVMKLIHPERFGEGKRSFIIRAPGSKNLARIDLDENGVGRFNADLLGSLGFDGKITISLAKVIYSAYNDETDKDLIGYETYATDVLTLKDAMSGDYASVRRTERGQTLAKARNKGKNNQYHSLDETLMEGARTAPTRADRVKPRNEPRTYVFADRLASIDSLLDSSYEGTGIEEPKERVQSTYRPNSFYARLQRHGYDDEMIGNVGRNMATEYVASDKTLKELAGEYGVSASTVRRLALKELSKRGINVKSRKEARRYS